jgi:hypothetical protein
MRGNLVLSALENLVLVGKRMSKNLKDMLHLYSKDIRLLIVKVQVFCPFGGTCAVFSLPFFFFFFFSFFSILLQRSQLKTAS